MKTHHHHHHHHHPTTKLKNPPRPLFTCGIFSYCTTSESVLSPTNNTPTPPSTFPPLVSDLVPHSSPPPPLPLSDPQPPPPPPPPPLQPESGSSSSSSSSTSQSFTQWRFPVPNSPIQSQPSVCPIPPNLLPESDPQPPSSPPPPTFTNLAELFHVAELQFSTGSEASKLSALHLLEKSLVPNPLTEGDQDPTTCCPPAVMAEIVGLLKNPLGAKPATKVLLALCLSEPNRHVAVEAGAVVEVIEALTEVEGSAGERALAALELLCTVGEGAAQLKQHALAVPVLIQVMGKMEGRGKECAVSVLALMFGGGFLMEEEEEMEDGHGGGGGGGGGGAPEAVGRAVVLALQGECSARGRRKGAQLLKVLQENGRLDLTQDGR